MTESNSCIIHNIQLLNSSNCRCIHNVIVLKEYFKLNYYPPEIIQIIVIKSFQLCLDQIQKFLTILKMDIGNGWSNRFDFEHIEYWPNIIGPGKWIIPPNNEIFKWDESKTTDDFIKILSNKEYKFTNPECVCQTGDKYNITHLSIELIYIGIVIVLCWDYIHI